jgi:hypothetical protein
MPIIAPEELELDPVLALGLFDELDVAVTDDPATIAEIEPLSTTFDACALAVASLKYAVATMLPADRSIRTSFVTSTPCS